MKNEKIAWKNIYAKLGVKRDFDNINIPDFFDPNFHFAVIISDVPFSNITNFFKKEKFEVWEAFEHPEDDIRHPNKDGDYLLILKKLKEAHHDRKLRGLPVNSLYVQNHKGITIRERLMLEIFYYLETGKNLDEIGSTLCYGSCYLSTPSVCTRDGFFLKKAVMCMGHKANETYDNMASRKVLFCSMSKESKLFF